MSGGSRFVLPYQTVIDGAGVPLPGALLFFYVSQTSTPLNTYSDVALTIPNTNPVAANAAGVFPNIFMPGVDYKVVLTDSALNQIWTADPVNTGFSPTENWVVAGGSSDAITALFSPPITSLVDGQIVWFRASAANLTATPTFSPNGLTPHVITKLGGQALAPSDIVGALAEYAMRYNLANTRWELLSTAAATGVAATTSTQPQGRLTLTSATPVLATDAVAQSTVFYTPYIGNTFPSWNGSTFVSTVFSELSMVMSGANFASGAIYDLFTIIDTGPTNRLGIGPVWNTLTPGSCARGTGAGTTELQRVNGIWVNKNTMTLRYASGSTVSVAPFYGTYVGSVYMDATNSQVSCYLSYGQSRKFGLWNAYNRVPIIMQAGDSTGSWSYTTNAWRASNNNANNSITVLTGLAEEDFNLTFDQVGATSDSNTSSTMNIAIGWNSTNSPLGKQGNHSSSLGVAGAFNQRKDMKAVLVEPPAIGISVAYCIENGNGGNSASFQGTSTAMVLLSSYRG